MGWLGVGGRNHANRQVYSLATISSNTFSHLCGGQVLPSLMQNTTGKSFHLVLLSPNSQPWVSFPAIEPPITTFQTDNKEATTINLSHLWKQHSGEPEISRKRTPPVVDTELLLVLSAWQDTKCQKHKFFDLVSGFTKG